MPNDAASPSPSTAIATIERPKTRAKRAQVLSRSIRQFKQDADRIQNVSRHDLEEVAEKYSRASSTFLAAIVGGAVGSAGGIAIGTAGAGLLVVTGPLGLALGAALGVLAFRGRSFWKIEKATQKARGPIDLVKTEIASLPHDAPQAVRDQLYAEYLRLVREYSRVAHDLIDDDPPAGRGNSTN